MLFKEAKRLGIDVQLMDGKNLKIETFQNPFVGQARADIYLQRCVGYFRSIHITRALESYGMIVENPFETALLCGNKFFTSLALEKARIPTPRTIIAFNKTVAVQALSEIGYPAMLKPVMGSWGRLIAPLNDEESAIAILESREYMHPIYQIYYIQKRVQRPPRDIRSVVVDGRFVTAIYRYQPENEWRTNTARGGRAEACPKYDELEELSIRAAKAVSGDIVGVDCMESEEGLVVHEVNNTVEFKNMVKVTGENIPAQIVEYLRSKATR